MSAGPPLLAGAALPDGGVGPQPHHMGHDPVTGGFVVVDGERYYAIRNYHLLPPFFMTLVSASSHWLFLSSTGGLSAGRASADSALFPYDTDDKLTENAEHTGPKTLLWVRRGERTSLWEPFSERYAGPYALERTLYKTVASDAVLFEETLPELGLRFRYGWKTSERFGFIREASLENLGDACDVAVLDGLQNLLPYGASSVLQRELSNLLNAYKQHSLEAGSDLGLFSLSSTLTDLAEPSESLRATTVWQVGLDAELYLLSSQHLGAFRQGRALSPERYVRAQRGAFFALSAFRLEAVTTRRWRFVAELGQDRSSALALHTALRRDRAGLWAEVAQDVAEGRQALRNLVAQADGLQLTGDALASEHHFANALFNAMRGGIFAEQHRLDKRDLAAFVAERNRDLYARCASFFAALPEPLSREYLVAQAEASGEPDLERLCREYLPLAFSRRHGDPSRPWNRFSINVADGRGGLRRDYEGNWRDIFQNWEALAYAFPDFSEATVCLFLNATTADGYNPYRLTRSGLSWEKPEPENPWANIGYWSDHQIIYLQRLLEAQQALEPGVLERLLDRPIFSYADVPYRIKPYAELLADPYDTILFDAVRDRALEAEAERLGGDAKLLKGADAQVLHATMLEKLLVLLLAKLSNFVPEGGIWMNTQRPEWNDANNALVGKGLSVVTTAYLRRFVAFLRDLLANAAPAHAVRREVAAWFVAVRDALEDSRSHLATGFGAAPRRAVMDALGAAGSSYRSQLYAHGLGPAHATLETADLLAFLDGVLEYTDQCLRANRRPDALYHAYNTLELEEGRARISHLDEMLEGQVAILSSGLLEPSDTLALLESLRLSRLYRPDQHSYLLYPDRALPGFLDKNRVPAVRVAGLELVTALSARGDTSLLVRDEEGDYQFNGDFKNVRSVAGALEHLAEQDDLRALVAREGPAIRALFEEVFDHAAFTGRSSTFFAYEGLGSIYWHMVSKLLLAVQEVFAQAARAGETADALEALKTHYYDIRAGLGFNKSPQVYGAFPTDPYSHTPAGEGAKQPGMTGQVKEELLTRPRELGLFVEGGMLVFDPALLRAEEWLTEASTFDYLDAAQRPQRLELPAGSFAYTFCQTPVVCLRGHSARIAITFADGRREELSGYRVPSQVSRHILGRSGQVRALTVYL